MSLPAGARAKQIPPAAGLLAQSKDPLTPLWGMPILGRKGVR